MIAAIVATWGVGFPQLAEGDTKPESLNQLTEEEKAAGWKLLFDGETTKGWRNYQAESVEPGWKVVDGALVMTTKGAGDIITVDQFDAFELKMQFKISPQGNSGVMYHVTEQGDTPWQTGPEAQIIDNAVVHEGEKAGWLYALYDAEVDTTRPAGQWNDLTLLITPEKCVHIMNGKKYLQYVKGSADWNARVAASKFSAFEHFGKATRGHICLQDHGDEVAFRNIKIKPLSLRP